MNTPSHRKPGTRHNSAFLFAVVAVSALLPPSLDAAVTPNPRISIGKSVFTNGNAANLDRVNDGQFADKEWNGGPASPSAPVWVAMKLGNGPSRVLVNWCNHVRAARFNSGVNVPGDYQIQTSADSTNGADGTWTSALAVTGNIYMNRVHAIDFKGQQWVRLYVTNPASKAKEIRLLELEVYDVSGGVDDSWMFLGDSITFSAFIRWGDGAFDKRINAQASSHTPSTVNGGIPGFSLGQMVGGNDPNFPNLDQVMAAFPDTKYWAIGFGTNDAGGENNPERYQKNMEALVQKLQATGKVPIIQKVPYTEVPARHPATIVRYNQIIDQINAKYQLLPGPDLWTWFQDHPTEINPPEGDGVHPSHKVGYGSMQRLWIQAVLPLYGAKGDPAPAIAAAKDIPVPTFVTDYDWCTLTCPKTCTPGKEFEVRLEPKDIKETSRNWEANKLNVHLHWSGKEKWGGYLCRFDAAEIAKEGAITLRGKFELKDNLATDASYVHVSAVLASDWTATAENKAAEFMGPKIEIVK